MESDYIWDPLRRKSVRNTPEEAVRQWFIGVLHEGMKVPEHMMGSEVAFSHAGKDYRADVVVYDRKARPLMVVECKRPEVTLDQNVVDQALRYNNELNVRYIVITNGLKTFIFERQKEGWQFMQKAPMWNEMIDPSSPAAPQDDKNGWQFMQKAPMWNEMIDPSSPAAPQDDKRGRQG